MQKYFLYLTLIVLIATWMALYSKIIIQVVLHFFKEIEKIGLYTKIKTNMVSWIQMQ